jgi:hypothetical protein
MHGKVDWTTYSPDSPCLFHHSLPVRYVTHVHTVADYLEAAEASHSIVIQLIDLSALPPIQMSLLMTKVSTIRTACILF